MGSDIVAEHLYTLLRTAVTFVVILILARIIGSKQLSQLTFFNYITGITIGSIAANIISRESAPFWDEIIGLIIWCLLAVLDSRLDMMPGKIRILLDGQPIIVIKKGKLLRDALRKAHLNMEELTMLLRELNTFSVTDVEYAILETNGKLTIMKKPQKQQVTKEDMNVFPPAQNFMPSEIIVDGRVITRNLTEFNLNEQWLIDTLKQQNIRSAKDVLYAELQPDGSLYVERK